MALGSGAGRGQAGARLARPSSVLGASPGSPPRAALDDPRKVDAALRAAVTQLESAVVEQERAVTRILGLAELLIDRAPDDNTRLRVEAVMESCAFQDVTGQRIRKVKALLSRLTTLPPGAVRLVEAPIAPPPDPARDDEPEGGLTQKEVDRLLGNQ